MKIYYGKAVYGKEEVQASLNVLRKKSLSLIDGPSVKKLENPSDNLNIGVVKEVAYLGSYTKYLIEVNGFEFYSFMQNSLVSDNLQIRWDDKVQISFNETSIYFFND